MIRNKRKVIKENRLQVVTVYEARRSRHTEEGGDSEHSEGFFSRREYAEAALRKNARDYFAKEIITYRAIRVNGRFYEVVDSVRLIKPLEIERYSRQGEVALSTGNKKMILVHTYPLRIDEEDEE